MSGTETPPPSLAARALLVFRKDLRRFWPAVLGAYGLVAVQILVGLPSGYAFGFRTPIEVLPLALALLAVAVVQEDGPADGRAFWPTRPVGSGAVITAKIAFLGLFLCAVPVAVESLWFARSGVRAPLVGMALDSLLRQGSLLAVFALLAAVTRSFRAFLVLAVAVWISWSLVPVSGLEATGLNREAVRITRMYVSRWVWLPTGILLLIHQYRFGRTGRTLAFAALCASVLAVVQRSPLDWTPDPIEPSRRFPYPAAEAIELRLAELGRQGGPRPAFDDGDEGYWAGLEPASGPGVILAPRTAEARLDGGGVEHTFLYDGWEGPFERLPTNQWAEIPGLRQIGLNPSPPRPNPIGTFVAIDAPAELDRLGEATRLEITLAVDVFQLAVRGTLTADVGATLASPGTTSTVREVIRSDRSFFLELERKRAVRALMPAYGGSEPEHLARVVLHNPGRSEYLLPVSRGMVESPVRRALLGGAAIVEAVERWEFNPDPSGRGRDFGFTDGWLDDVEILLVGVDYVGSFTRTITHDVEEWPDRGRPIRTGRDR